MSVLDMAQGLTLPLMGKYEVMLDERFRLIAHVHGHAADLNMQLTKCFKLMQVY